MQSCGVIVEYNPFHNGHQYHLQQARELSKADCIIAIMSGQFLQRGEPAIMDKWYRSEAALANGADIVLELPYLYAVEHSDYFSKGAVRTLSEVGVNSICFGSEQGNINAFTQAYEHMLTNETVYNETVKTYLRQGFSFPEASKKGYEMIHFPEDSVDLSQPNNILGYGYVREGLTYDPSIKFLTIQRTNSHYHDEAISGTISSATSIRKELKKSNVVTNQTTHSMPVETTNQLIKYQERIGLWHDWENYFTLLYYKILTMSDKDLRGIHGVDEGLEHRLKRTIKQSKTFNEFMSSLKTKRYTWTRLQRTLVHILIGTTKIEAQHLLRENIPPYARMLGMNETGQKYLSIKKKQMKIPLITQPQQFHHPLLDLEERASISYYSILNSSARIERIAREFGPPLLKHSH